MTFAVLASGLAAAVAIDVRTRRIPNVLTATMALAGLGLAAAGESRIGLGGSLAGLLLGLLLMLPGRALGATGAGDVKLMAAVGSLVGPALVVSAFLMTCVSGGVLALLVATRRRRLADTVARTRRLIAAPVHAPEDFQAATAARRFAYGPAIAAGSLLAVLMA